MSKIKICLVIPSLLPGGMERVMSELITHFSKKMNTEIHLVLYGLDPSIFYAIPDQIHIHIPDWEFDNSKRTWHTLKRMWFLRQTIRAIRPDSVLSFGEYWNSFALISLWGLKLKLYVSDRCQPDKSLGNLHDNLRSWIYPTAKAIIAQTQTAKDVYRKQFKNSRIEVIGNPIRRITANTKPEDREKIVLTVGRLIQSKHHDQLIDVFMQINKPDWKLVIVGGDALKENGFAKLKQKIETLGAEHRVQLTGNISNVDDYYVKSSIFAFTSSSEGFPNVIGEAMSAGLPVVAYDCVAGPSDMILDGKNGFLIPLFDSILFRHKLEQLMSDSDLRVAMGAKAKETISAFEVEAIGEKYFNLMCQ